MTKVPILPILLLFIVFCSNAQRVTKNGPEGGGMGSLAATSNTVFAGTYFGGVYRSTDGVNWTPSYVNDRNLNVRKMIAAGSYVFAAFIGPPGVARTKDEGETWEPANGGLAFSTAVNCFASNETGLWIGTYNGIYLSTDNGDQWTEKTSDLEDKYIICMTAHGSNVFAGTQSGLYVSEDGDSWTPVQISESEDGPIRALGTIGNKIFVSLEQGVYSSINGGESWTLSNEGLPAGNRTDFIQAGDKIYAPGLFSIYVSDDGGEEWSLAGAEGILVESLVYFKGKLIGGSWPNGIMASSNGTDWALSNSGLYANPIDGMITIGDSIFVVSAMTGIYSAKEGEQWSKLKATDEFIPINITSRNDSIYVGGNGGVQLSTNSGESWNPAGLDGKYVIDVVFGSGIICAITQDEFFISTNKGETWTPKNDNLPDASITSIAINADHIFLGTNHGIYISTNMGDDWTEADSDLNETYIEDFTFTSDKVFAATDHGVLMSTNDGDDWEDFGDGLRDGANSLTIEGPHIFAATDRGVFASGLSPTEWTDISGNISGMTVHSIAITSNSVLAGTSGLGVAGLPKILPTSVSPNAAKVGETVTITGGLFGATAEENEINFNGVVADASYTNVISIDVEVPEGATSGPLKVNFGDHVFEAGEFTVIIDDPEDPVTGINNNDGKDLNIYPNPFRDAIVVGNPEPVRLRLTDTVGRPIVDTVVNGRIDLQGLAAGVYFAKVEANGSTKTVRLLKVN